MKLDSQTKEFTFKNNNLLGTKIFSINDQFTFAEASGDFNPIHINSKEARRTLYGECIVHGIHGLLWAMNLMPIRSGFSLEEVKVVFKKPIFLNKRINCFWYKETDTIKLFYRSTLLTQITFKFVKGIKNEKSLSITTKERLDFPSKTNISKLKLNIKHPHAFYGNYGILKKLFPIFLKRFGESLLLETIALSEIVGMRIPGLNSIFISAEIKLEKKKGRPFFLVENSDERFGLANLIVKAYNSISKLSTIYRPEIVIIPKLQDIKKNINIEENEFKKCRALIIGGSRGLGAWVAKILAIGQGQSTITYASGINEAKEIEKDINSKNNLCNIRYLNVNDNLTLNLSDYNQIYYFASPKILKNIKKNLDKRLYNKYFKFYVKFFKNLLDKVQCYENIKTVFYPSTVFLNQNEDGFKEYLMAKSLGEKLCKKISTSNKLMVASFRLPKLETDQTSSFIKSSKADHVKVLLPIIRQLKKQIEN